MIKVENLVKIYGNEESELIALNNLSLSFEAGNLYAIIGKSGSGKTTLLNIIGGFLSPTSGNIEYNGENIINYTEKQKAEFRNKMIGYIFQFFYLEPKMSVIDNVCLPLLISGTKKEERELKARQVLEKLNILNYIDKKVSKMSGGEQQRVAIARALINDANIILADEPTGNLDTQNGKIVMDELKKLSNDGKLVILITHNDQYAKDYADYIIELSDGKIIRKEKNAN